MRQGFHRLTKSIAYISSFSNRSFLLEETEIAHKRKLPFQLSLKHAELLSGNIVGEGGAIHQTIAFNFLRVKGMLSHALLYIRSD